MSDKRAGEMSLGVEISKGLVAKVVHAVLGFVGTIIFARVLGPASFGGYYLLLTVTELTKRSIDGTSNATKKRFSEAGAPRSEILGTQLATNLGVILLTAIGAFLFQGWLRSYTGVEKAAALLLVLFVVTANFTSFQSFLSAIGRVGTQMWIGTLQSVTVLISQLVFVTLGLGVAGMVYGMAVGELVLIPLTHFYLRVRPKLPSRETARSVWRFARYSVPSSFVGKAYDRFDVLLLGFLAVPAAAGYYEVAYKLTIPAIFVTNVASQGLMAKVSDLHSRSEDVTADITNTLAFSSIFAIPLFFGALAMAEPVVVTAYSQSYAAAATLLVGLALYRIVQTQTDVLVSVVKGLDSPRVEMWVSTFALVVNIVLGVALFMRFQALGVVIATVIAESIRYVSLLWIVSRQTDATLFPEPLFAQLGSGVVMFGVVTLANQYVGVVRSWVELAVLMGIGGIVYFCVLSFLSGYFRRTVLDVFGELLHTYRERRIT